MSSRTEREHQLAGEIHHLPIGGVMEAILQLALSIKKPAPRKPLAPPLNPYCH